MLKFASNKLGGKSLMVLVVVCTALLPLVGFSANIVSQDYFKENYDSIFENFGYDINNIFYVYKDTVSVYAFYKNNSKYQVISLQYKETNQTNIESRNVGSIIYYSAIGNFTKISNNELYNYINSNKDIILSRYNTSYLNVARGTNSYVNGFYVLMLSINGYNTGNIYYMSSNMNANKQFDLFVNQYDNFVIKDFKYENFSSYPQFGLQSINDAYSINMNLLNNFTNSLRSVISGGIFIGTVTACIAGAVLWWLITASLDLLKTIVRINLTGSFHGGVPTLNVFSNKAKGAGDSSPPPLPKG